MIYFETLSSFSHWLSLLFSFQRPMDDGTDVPSVEYVKDDIFDRSGCHRSPKTLSSHVLTILQDGGRWPKTMTLQAVLRPDLHL